MRGENQRLHIELGNFEAEREEFIQELAEVRSQLEAERTDRRESKVSAPGVAEFPEPSSVLNQLKGRRRKSKTDLLDVESILEILEAEAAKLFSRP